MIEIDSFTGFEEERQALDLRNLVRGDKEWLKAARPDTWHRLHKFKRAVGTLQRAALDDVLSIHTIRREGAAIGIATIITALTVKHPLIEESFTGRQIDYWTQAGVQDEQHEEIVHKLMGLHDYQGTVLATLIEAEEERAKGIPRLMEPVGRRSWLEIPGQDDRFGLSRIPDLQLYVSEA